MKKFLTTLFLIILFCGFTLFIKTNSRLKTVLSVITPTKFQIDLNNNKARDKSEYICVDGVEAFSLAPDDYFINKYSKSLNLSDEDIINLGYLAQEFAQNTLTNKKVTLNFTNKITKECKYAKVKINGIEYKQLLNNSGYGIDNGEIGNPTKFKQNLQISKKLNLVILNHRSGKYHKLDCPYGNVAHDKIIIPLKQLPKNSKPCKYCHVKQPAKSKNKLNKNRKNITPAKNNFINLKQPTLTCSSSGVKVYYTDFSKKLTPDKNCTETVCKEVLKLINNTKETLDIAIYGYDNIPNITSALVKAKNRGVNIRFVYDENFNPAKTYYKDNNIIANLSVQHRSDRGNTATISNMLMHNKFLISDKQTILTGSMNLSKTGLSGYDVNDIIIISSKEIAELYTKEFEQMLGGNFHTKKDKITDNKIFTLGNSQIEILFSPKDKSSNRITQIIKNAKFYIYIPTFLITHTQIANELINAKNRGVDVRIIIDANSANTRNSKHAMLRQNGILLKTENYAGKLHSKTIIIDDEYLITGSMNLSNSGENKNDENTIIIKNSQIAKHHKEFFLYLWALIPNKYLKYNAKSESHESIGSCSDGIDNNFNGKTDKEEDLCR